MDTPGVAVVKAALEPLCGDLHDIFASGVHTAKGIRREHGLGEAVYASLGADLTRAIVHRELEERGGVEGWQLDGKHHLRGQLLLRSGLMRLRLLHQAVGLVPPPGHNAARRAYYRNPPFGQVTALDAESSNLIAIWNVDDPELATVRFRVVRTISDRSRWRGDEAELDLDFILPNTGADLSSLEFVQVDEDLTLDLPLEVTNDDEVADDGATEDEGGASGDVG